MEILLDGGVLRVSYSNTASVKNENLVRDNLKKSRIYNYRRVISVQGKIYIFLINHNQNFDLK